jgi:putative transposase
MVQLTLKLRLSGSASAFVALRETANTYTESFNRVSQVAYYMPRQNKRELHKLTYDTERGACDLPSQLVCSARDKAYEAVKSTLERKKKGKQVSCPRSHNAGIRFDKNSATIKLKEGTATLATIQGRQAVRFHVPKYAKEREGFKVCSSELKEEKKGRLYLHVVLEHPVPETVETNQVEGVDLGVVRPAVTSHHRFLGERRWREIQNRTFRLRRELQAKGTRSAKRKLQRLSKRENGFRKDCDHVLSKKLAQSVPPGSTLVLEDLTDIRERIKGKKRQRRRLHSWSFHRFAVFLAYKCKLLGVKVEFIDPHYTSQECSRCGHICKENRLRQSEFSCQKCKLRLNADVNAARVIKKRYLAKSGMTVLCGRPVNPPIVSSKNQSEPVLKTATSLGTETSFVL